MYINKCTKCGKEFETKNPKRVICPACLYPDRAAGTPAENEAETPKEETAQQPPAQSTYTRSYSTGNTGSYSAGGTNMPYKRPQQRENYPPRQNNNGRPGGGFRKPFNKFQITIITMAVLAAGLENRLTTVRRFPEQCF
jgi:hypothetical protein